MHPYKFGQARYVLLMNSSDHDSKTTSAQQHPITIPNFCNVPVSRPKLRTDEPLYQGQVSAVAYFTVGYDTNCCNLPLTTSGGVGPIGMRNCAFSIHVPVKAVVKAHP